MCQIVLYRIVVQSQMNPLDLSKNKSISHGQAQQTTRLANMLPQKGRERDRKARNQTERQRFHWESLRLQPARMEGNEISDSTLRRTRVGFLSKRPTMLPQLAPFRTGSPRSDSALNPAPVEITRLNNDFLGAKNSPTPISSNILFQLATHSVHRFGLVKIELDRSRREKAHRSVLAMVPFLYSVSQAEVEKKIDRVDPILDGLDRNLTLA